VQTGASRVLANATFWRNALSMRRALLLLTLAACESPTVPEYVNRRPFDPLVPTYLEWWDDLRVCSAISRDFEGIRWYLADEIPGEVEESKRILGDWRPGREITILDGQQVYGWVVIHEMLHDLLRGDPIHSSPLWGECVPPRFGTVGTGYSRLEPRGDPT
jgi:hypothetical protein